MTERVTKVFAPGIVTKITSDSALLMVQFGPAKGRTVVVRSEPVMVGAAAECGLVLDDPTVSRKHAEVRFEDRSVVVKDLGSTNGTYYQDARVREVLVPLGGEVRFGETRVKIVPEELPLETKPIEESSFGRLIGGDVRMRETFALIKDIAESDVTVVIEGETGTGKELVAEAIHEHSRRARAPFVVFDCSNQPRDLIASALFGHVKGSFTGAAQDRTGAFQKAHQGTVFLDEIGELELELQPKLLRVMEARQVQKVGGDGYQDVDVRVITATNRQLRGEVKAGRFREDLYYRLAVVRIMLPPLRDRPDDIALLVEHFVDLAGSPLTVDPKSVEHLKSHDWPGNVRELKNVVDRAVALARGQQNVDLTRYLNDVDPPADGRAAGSEVPLSPSITDGKLPFKEAKGMIISEFESKYIENLLRQHNNNISMAAREAGIDRKHFKDLMRKHGIEARARDSD